MGQSQEQPPGYYQSSPNGPGQPPIMQQPPMNFYPPPMAPQQGKIIGC